MREDEINPAKRTRHPLLSFLVIAVFFQAMGALVGWITAQEIEGWYQTLRRSPLNPPDYVFGLVWTALYFLLSVGFWLIWKKENSREKNWLLGFFAAHMILNWAWSPLFFALHATGPAFLAILIMVFSAAMIAWLAWNLDKRVSLIFIPYLLWLMFAGHLAHYIWQSN